MYQHRNESNAPLSYKLRRRSIGIENQGIDESNDDNNDHYRSYRELNIDSSTRSTVSNTSRSNSDDPLFSSPSQTSRGSIIFSEDERSKTTLSQEFSQATSQLRMAENPRIQELTINKLKYDSVGLVGREKEVATLRECCNRAFQHSETNKELVLIKGTSGVGKTSLTKTVKEQISSAPKGIFGKGKFNLESSAHPFSGLADALSQLYRHSVLVDANNTEEDVRQLKKELSSELGDDVTLLAALIPGLEAPPATNLLVRHRSGLMRELYNPDSEQAQWKSAFKVFIRVLCQYCSPVVLVIEDLQWADRSSLDVMEDLLSDPFNKESLMIIGTFRSDEVNDGHALSTKIQTLQKKKTKFNFAMTEIEPQNLLLDDVHRIIMALLGMDDENTTRGLAEICFKRTHGNPNFVLQFITVLEEEGLISFNLGLLKWVWDDKVVESETMSTANVVDLLQLRMKKLPSDMRLLLQYAACLGSTFDPSVLTLLWEKNGVSEMSEGNSTMKLLENLKESNFLETHGAYYWCEKHGASEISEGNSTMKLLENLKESNFLETDGVYYWWVHDKVQETALEMEEAQKPSFYFEVGSTLLNHLPDDKLEVLLFVVTNLINKSNVRGRLEFAELNLRAAEKAQRLSAFYTGASYVAKAIKLLPSSDDKWKEHRDMTLHIYTIGAEMEVATGNIDIAQQYCDVILKRDDYTPLEKFRLYMVKINILCSVTVQLKEAVDFSLDVLKEFGCKLAPNPLLLPVHTIRSLKKTIKLAKKTTKAEYRSLKPSDDTKLEAIMTVLHRVGYACVQANNPLLLALSTVKMVDITLEHGLFSVSGAAQCILGMVCLAALGDVATATYFAEMGALMQKSIPSKYFEATVMLVSYHVVLPWSEPFGSCRPKLQNGYLEGIRTGNLVDGMWCLLSYSLFTPLQTGMSLKSIDANFQAHMRLVEDLKQSDHAFTMKLYRRLVLGLMGESDETTMISSSGVLSEEDSQEQAKSQRALASTCLCDYISFVYFGNFEQAAKLSLTKGGVHWNHYKGHSLGLFESFLRGVALFAMARKTKKRKYRKPATKILKFMAKVMKQGNPNVQHYFTLLSAESAALNKDKIQAEKLYQQTIVYAARTGQLSHAALSNERYSDFLLHELHDLQEAKYRMDEAIRFYRDWGAQAKVDMLQGSSHMLQRLNDYRI